jgi:hypothetical protein
MSDWSGAEQKLGTLAGRCGTEATSQAMRGVTKMPEAFLCFSEMNWRGASLLGKKTLN